MKPALIINGAAGRMGKRIVALACESGQFNIVGATDYPQHPDMGKDIGLLAGIEPINVPLTAAFPDSAAVMIDFSLPQAADAAIDYCAKNGVSLVMGTTGLSEAQLTKLKNASCKIAIVQATNMSLGMNLLFATVGKVAKALGENYDIEIVEAHHRFKKDAPSGTALSLAEAVCQETGRDYPGSLTHGRQGKETSRQKGTIGMHAIRGGDIVGEHRVIYSTLGETVTISHSAHTRDTFVRGALGAAEWVASQNPGLYDMQDVLRLTDRGSDV
ncbi:MAG: 4-hydroxy-tetrahydrodipicolinate reductase [Planctomycetota bacterium]|nr:MAG: 4-hydroxy-tetrahydrodipicolinate reductase [Planctomycetota bacterium]RKY14428.1 MAG: 4-hydroxy-tetrahydrodipicolinate reductase [Planctomycetota bacterium]